MHSLQKIMMRLRGTNFCTSSARFIPSFIRQPNSPECTQIVQNAPKHKFRVQWLDRVRSLQKILKQLHGTNFCTSSARFAPSFVRHPNGPECTQIVRKEPKHQFRVQWGWIERVCYEKFRSRFGIFRNKRARSTPIGP